MTTTTAFDIHSERGGPESGVLANGADFYFERGGPVYRLMQRIGVIKGAGPSVERVVLFAVAVTYVPLVIFAIIDGRALSPTPHCIAWRKWVLTGSGS